MLTSPEYNQTATHINSEVIVEQNCHKKGSRASGAKFAFHFKPWKSDERIESGK